ncbi:MAG: toxin-antitoxin system HicB family antitoxin [Candidatus Riflebacteria bacterium]|nr:toxin-antitoxin system HicB family antitoxin [Candidatus Riflebacteria bacterium]MBR4570768.1 toxin-antitoxin system HicB family antitoxin [Candidatus Riflebacteria bacterium]
MRLPKSLHASLLNQAKLDNISMNTLAVALIAEGLGKKLAYK